MKNFNKKLEELRGNTTNPFSVPENYFDELPTRIQEKVAQGKNETSWFYKAIQYIKPQLALGFMFIAFAAISFSALNYIITARNERALNPDLYTRIMSMDASEFTEQHFLEIILEEQEEELSKRKIETDHYINYLIDEDIDYGILIDEF